MDGSGSGLAWDGSTDRGETAASGVYLAAANVDGDTGPVFRVEVCVVSGPGAGFFEQAFLAPNPLGPAGTLRLYWGQGVPPPGLEMEGQVYDLSGALVAALAQEGPGVLAWTPPASQAPGIYLVHALARTLDGTAVRRRLKLAILK
jgi:hypothetical protein